MVAPVFRAARKFLGPSWLTSEGDSQLVGYSLDVVKDAFIERLRLGLLARFPQNDPTGETTAPDDALAALGHDRRITRGINETPQRYARRLVRWLDDWKTAGNPFALMKQLAGFCGDAPTFRTVDVRGNWYSYFGPKKPTSVVLNTGNWNWDSAPDSLKRWSRFWVIIYPNGLWLPTPKWGDGGKWGDPGRTWGSTATSDEVAGVRQIVRDWKPAGTRCVNIILAFDNSTFSPGGAGLPDGTYGRWGTYSPPSSRTTYVPTRIASARYWDGV